MKVYKHIYDTIGHTPIVELNNIAHKYNLKNKIFAKIESFNPGRSVKDRIAINMILDGEAKGLINKDTVIIEPTSGNTGIGLAMVCASKGYHLIIAMPETMSIERQKVMRAYGVELILTDGKKGMKGSLEKVEELKKIYPNHFIPSQFENMVNPRSHFEGTGVEIYEDLDGHIDFFVAGIGTGGTISGVGQYLKSKNNDIKIIGVEPKQSPLLTEGIAGPHKIEGIGANFVPKTLNKDVIDEIKDIDQNAAIEMGRLLAREEGILVGISSGAAFKAALDIALREDIIDKNIIVLFPDTGERYLSTEMFK